MNEYIWWAACGVGLFTLAACLDELREIRKRLARIHEIQEGMAALALDAEERRIQG